MLYLILITKYFFCCFVFVLFVCFFLFVCLFFCCFFFSSGLFLFFVRFWNIKLVNKNTKISIKALPGYTWVIHFHQQVDLAKMSEMQQTDRQTQKLIHVHHYKYRVWNLRSPTRQWRVQNELFTCTHVYSPSVTSMNGLISEPGSAGPLSWFGSAGLISWTVSVGLISGAGIAAIM